METIRDTQKWPKRDKRTDSNLLDLINFNLLSPYTIDKMIKGRRKLMDIREASDPKRKAYTYERMKIEKHALDRGIQLYEMAIWKFLGNSLITRLNGNEYKTASDIQEALQPDMKFGKGYWVDLAGMICPFEALDQLLQSIENGAVQSLEEVNSSLVTMHKNYYNFEWTWAVDVLESFYGKSISEFEASDVITIVKKWKESVLGIDRFLYEDARKEFSMSKMTGFGVDGQEGARELDFAEVRGEFEDNATVKEIKEHMEKKERLGSRVIEQMMQVWGDTQTVENS